MAPLVYVSIELVDTTQVMSIIEAANNANKLLVFILSVPWEQLTLSLVAVIPRIGFSSDPI